MRLPLSILVVILCFTNFYAQKLNTSWTKTTCQIGEQTQLTIQFSGLPSKKGKIKPIHYRELSGEIACEMRVDSSALIKEGILEIIGSFKDTSFTHSSQTMTWQGKYAITAWDTGVYIFPLIQIPFLDSTYSIQATPLTIQFTKKKIDDELDEFHAKLPEDNWRLVKKHGWIVALIGVIATLFWMRKRNTIQNEKQLTLQQRTQIALEALRKQAYWKTGQLEKHYTEFSFLLRSFLSVRYALNFMERTSKESIVLLQAKGVEKQTLQQIELLLNESDMVKFAKNAPDEELILNSLNRLEELIIELSPLDLIS